MAETVIKLTRSVATKEINGWLDAKKIKDGQRESSKDSIETLIECVMEGDLLVNADGTLTQNLLFPIGSNGEIKALTFKNRLNDRMLEPHLKGIKGTDVFAVLSAYIAALTDTTKTVLSHLDSADSRVGKSIAVFFM